MELTVEISELKLLEFGYYVLQVSAENATNNGTLQINCIHCGTTTNCGQTNLTFDCNGSVILATGISTVLLENRHSKLLNSSDSDNVTMQSVIMSL